MELLRPNKGPFEAAFSEEKPILEKKSWFNYDAIDKEPRPHIVMDKEKVVWLRASRDYSFLFSSDNDNEFKVATTSVNRAPRPPWIVDKVTKSCASMTKKKVDEESRKEKVGKKLQVSSSRLPSRRRRVIYDDEDEYDDNDTDKVSTFSDDTNRSKKITRKIM